MSSTLTCWRHKSLGEVCNLIGGGTPSKKNEDFYTGNIPWATVRDMKNSVLSQTEFRITEEAVKKSSTNIIKSNNVVIATRVGLGKVCFIVQDTAINQDLRGIIPKKADQLTVRYLFWWLKSIAHLIEKEGTGATVKGVKLPFVKGLQIPLPPLPEQKRIVAILDKAFEGINQAVSNAEKNLANARELFESYLNNVFTQKGDGWVEKELGDVCDLIGGGTPSKKNDAFYTGEIPWATVRDMNENLIVRTDFKITSEAVMNSSTNIIKSGNVIIATSVGLGKVCLLAQDTAINQDLRGIIPKKTNQLTVRYLFWWLKSIAHLIEKEGTGATVKGVKLPFVKSLRIPLFPLSKQEVIGEQLDTLQEETQHLQTIYQQKLNNLQELKQSILQKAFSGDLKTNSIQ